MFHKCYVETFQFKKWPEERKLQTYLNDHPGQVLITTNQIKWTDMVHNALLDAEKKNYQGMKNAKSDYKKKVKSFVNQVVKPGIK